MNAKKVPQLFVSTGAAKWNDPKNFPWTMGWQPNYQVEARIYAAYILKNHPGKTIGVLYQNDDFGKDYVIGLREGLGDQANKLIVMEASYETSSPTVDSQIVQIKAANPDILINISTPKFAAQAIKKPGELKWKPVHFLTNVSVSVGSVMKPAGYENGQGVLSAAYLKDPKDPQWKNDPGLNEWRAFMTKWYPEGDQEDAATVFAYGVAKGLEQVLRQCKDDLTRENIMRQAANLNFEIGIYLPGTRIKTSPTDFAPLEQLQMMRFKGESWELFGPLMSGEKRVRENFVFTERTTKWPVPLRLSRRFVGRDDRWQFKDCTGYWAGPAWCRADPVLENAPVDALVDMLFSGICGIGKSPVFDTSAINRNRPCGRFHRRSSPSKNRRPRH